MFHQHRFHIHRRDVLARAADDVLLPVHKEDAPLGITTDDVPRVEPAIRPGRVGGCRILVVMREKARARLFPRATDQQFTRLLRRGVVSRIGHNAQRHVRPGTTKRGLANQAVRTVVRDRGGQTGFGHGPSFAQGKAKAFLERRMQFGIDPCAEPKPHGMGAVLVRGRHFHQDRRHHPQVMQAGRAGCAHILPPGFGVKPVQNGQTAAHRQHTHEGRCHCVHVKQGQGRDHALPVLAQRGNPAKCAIPVARHQEIGVRQNAAFGMSGCTRGIKHGGFAGGTVRIISHD